MKQHKKPLQPAPSRLASAVRNGIRADANHPVRDAMLRASNAVTSHAIGALGAGVSAASALSHAGDIAADAGTPSVRTDSFGGLVHKLEDKGKSAHYAKAIAGKVAKEKGDIGKRKDANPEAVQPTEEFKMADVAEVKRQLDAMRDQIDEICNALGDDEVRDDESAQERSEASSLGDYHRHGEHESKKHVRDDADEAEEHKAGEELARGAKDEREGDESEGEEDEHEGGEELAAGRDDAESESERSEASEEGHEHHDEERGDKSPTELAEPITEADAVRDDLQGHMKGGEFHPIRGSKGYAKGIAGDKTSSPRSRHDSQGDSDGAIRSKIAALEARLSRAIRPVSREERDAMGQAQARCDSVAQMFGLRAEPPLAGEHLDAYRRRLVAPLQKYSKDFAKANIDRLDASTFAGVERHIYADAQAAAKMDDNPVAGRLTPVRSMDAAGRTITKYYGDPNAWMTPFKARGVSIRFNRDSNR